MAVAVSRALERGAPGIVCASTGNTAASAAAYAARAGLPAIVVTSRGAVARGKMIQAHATGVEAREVDGTFSDAHLEARRLAEAEGLVNVNSINPDRIEGQSSAAREVLEQLGGLPDVLALPYGGGGNTVATRRVSARGPAAALPPRRGGTARTTRSRARSGSPSPCTGTGRRVLERSGGRSSRSRRRIIERAWRSLAREEGIFCEPASAAGSRRSRRPGCATSSRLRRHGPRPQGPRRGLSETFLRVRAPATTANIGPGFDCAGAALDLWNELELRRATAPSTANTSASARSSASFRPTAGASSSGTTSRRPAGSARAPRSSHSGWSPR